MVSFYNESIGIKERLWVLLRKEGTARSTKGVATVTSLEESHCCGPYLLCYGSYFRAQMAGSFPFGHAWNVV